MEKFKEILRKNLKLAISAAFFTLLVLHRIFPDYVLDNTSLYLALLAVLPWVLPLIPKYIKSFKLPGGFEVELNGEKIDEAVKALQAVQPKEEKKEAKIPEMITNSLPPKPKIISGGIGIIPPLFDDANLSLIDLGIEIEKRVKNLAEKKGVYTGGNVLGAIEDLLRNGLISPSAAITIAFNCGGMRQTSFSGVTPSASEQAASSVSVNFSVTCTIFLFAFF